MLSVELMSTYLRWLANSHETKDELDESFEDE